MSKNSNKQNAPKSQSTPKHKAPIISQPALPEYRPSLRRVTPPRPSISPKQTGYGRRFWIFTGVGIVVFSSIGRYSYSVLTAEQNYSQQLHIPEDVSDRFNKTAKNYDSEIEGSERWSGIGWLRRWLTKKARGNVLEVSVGTGRNSMYYDLRECKSITMLDQSPEMMEITRKKFWRAHPGYMACRFVTQSAHDPILAPPNGFDTIVQTMGLCSTPQPVALLKHLGTIVNPENGQILLLEHGRSHYAWLNRVIDSSAAQHADKHGCWWNKDIGQIVEESGLEIVKIKRYHLGTTWWIELKAKQKSKPAD